VQNWKQANPNRKIAARDLTTSNLSSVTAEWIGAACNPEASRTTAQNEVLALFNRLIADLPSANEYVFGVPMHNFAVPSVLKLWIDQIVRLGKTFSSSDGVPAGLRKNKKTAFIIASGGIYEAGRAMTSFDFVEPYPRSIFGFAGVTDTSFLAAGGVAALTWQNSTWMHPHC